MAKQGSIPEVDIVIGAIVGAAGLPSALAAATGLNTDRLSNGKGSLN